MSTTVSLNNSTITSMDDGDTISLSTAGKYVANDIIISDTTDVSAALSAIASKGVTVPSGATRSDLASLISQIQQITFVESTNQSSSATLTGAIPTESLTDGQVYLYKTAYALPESSQSVQFTNSAGTTLTSYPLYAGSTVRSIAAFPANSFILFAYYSSAFYLINSPTVA